MNQIGKEIKKLRTERELTQDQLAEKLNVTRQAVSNWETGKTQPDLETLTALADIFEVSVEELIYANATPKKMNVSVNKSSATKTGVSFGAVLATVISYTQWRSIGWAILHGILGWFYVIYYIIKY